jgi:hypothetical protein
MRRYELFICNISLVSIHSAVLRLDGRPNREQRQYVHRVRSLRRVSRAHYMLLLDSDDVKNVDLTKVHNLSGPIAVEGAEPGDCLVVDILDGKIFAITPHH